MHVGAEIEPVDALAADHMDVVPGEVGEVEDEDIVEAGSVADLVHLDVSTSVYHHMPRFFHEVTAVAVSWAGWDTDWSDPDSLPRFHSLEFYILFTCVYDV